MHLCECSQALSGMPKTSYVVFVPLSRGLVDPSPSRSRHRPGESALPLISQLAPKGPQVADLTHFLIDWVPGQKLISTGDKLSKSMEKEESTCRKKNTLDTLVSIFFFFFFPSNVALLPLQTIYTLVWSPLFKR